MYAQKMVQLGQGVPDSKRDLVALMLCYISLKISVRVPVSEVMSKKIYSRWAHLHVKLI